MKFTLPNGVTIETDSFEEAAKVLGAMGIAPVAPVPQIEVPPRKAREDESSETFGKWTTETAGLLLRTLNPSGLKLVEKLVAEGSMTTEALAKTFGYADKRGVGGMLGPTNRTAKELLLPMPIATETADDGNKVLTIDPGFRAAARKIKQASPKGSDV